MSKQESISERMYYRLQTTGDRIYGLAKFQKMPLRPVLFIPRSSYHKLNKYLGANIETSTRKEFKLIVLDDNKQIVSLDFKILYTKVPVSESIEIALKSLYSGDNAPDI